MSDLAFDPIEVRAEITRVTDEALLIADELADQALRAPSDPLTRNAAADYREKRTLIRRLRRMLIADGRG